MEQFKFKDKYDTEWDLSIDLATAKYIDKCDPGDVTDKKYVFLNADRDFFMEVFSNRPFAAFLAFLIVQFNDDNFESKVDLLEHEKGDQELRQLKFIKRLNGEALAAMHQTLIKAIADFFPEQRTALSKMIEKLDLVNERLRMETENLMPQVDEMLNKELDQAIAEARENLSKSFAGQRGESSSPASAN
jgi:hypothetical protein